MYFIVLLIICASRLIAANIKDIELHVTPVQYVSNGGIVQLKCEINVTTTVSKVLPNGLRITWYDEFIPIPAMGNVYEMNGYQLRQIIVNISVTGWLQFGRYVCKMEDNNGTITMKSTAVIPEGMREEDIISDITPEHPSVVTISCPVVSSPNVYWSKLTVDHSKQFLYRQGTSFSYNLSSYDRSAKFVCHSEHLHSIIYVHPKDYDPVRFIYPEENTTFMFDSLDSKLIECRIIGSVQPNMSWIHGNTTATPSDIVKRIYTVDSVIGNNYILQLVMNSLIPYVDIGEYACVVENEWETVNQSITIAFELLKGNPFQISTFAPVQYMFEGVDFTSRCFIQVDKNTPNHAKITTNMLFYKSSCNNAASIYPTVLESDDSKVEVNSTEQYDDNGDIWVVVELTIFNTTVNDSGCYQCLAENFDHTNNSLSNVIFVETPFNITSYEPEIILVERGSNITLLCEVVVDEDYDMHLVSVYYRYYATPEIEYVKYNAEINIDTVNKTITAELSITLVDIQHLGLYECYARSLPVDLYIDPDDLFYEVSQNTTVNLTIPLSVDAVSVNSDSDNTLMIVLVTSITAVIVTTLLIILIVIIICMKKHKSMNSMFDAISRSAKRRNYNEYHEEPSTISAVNKVATIQPEVVYHITPKSCSE